MTLIVANAIHGYMVSDGYSSNDESVVSRDTTKIFRAFDGII